MYWYLSNPGILSTIDHPDVSIASVHEPLQPSKEDTSCNTT